MTGSGGNIGENSTGTPSNDGVDNARQAQAPPLIIDEVGRSNHIADVLRYSSNDVTVYAMIIILCFYNLVSS